MQIRKKTPSHSERIAATNERTGTALFVFEQAANELELVRDEHYETADDATTAALALQAQARNLLVVADEANAAGLAADAKAEKMRALLG